MTSDSDEANHAPKPRNGCKVYAKLSIRHSTFRTSIVELDKDGASWDPNDARAAATLHEETRSGHDSTGELLLLVRVKEKKTLAVNSVLGAAQIDAREAADLSSATGLGHSTRGYPLRPLAELSDGQCCGEVFIMVYWEIAGISDCLPRAPTSKVREGKRRPLLAMASERDTNVIMRSKLKVWVVAARGLIAEDSNNLASPYCVLKLCGARRSTNVVSKSFCPVWEERFAFGGDECPREHVSVLDCLRVRVKGRRPALHDEFLGGLELPLWALSEAHADAGGKWYSLRSEKGGPSATQTGEICLRVRFIPGLSSRDLTLKHPKRIIRGHRSDYRSRALEVVVHIVQARGLPSPPPSTRTANEREVSVEIVNTHLSGSAALEAGGNILRWYSTRGVSDVRDPVWREKIVLFEDSKPEHRSQSLLALRVVSRFAGNEVENTSSHPESSSPELPRSKTIIGSRAESSSSSHGSEMLGSLRLQVIKFLTPLWTLLGDQYPSWHAFDGDFEGAASLGSAAPQIMLHVTLSNAAAKEVTHANISNATVKDEPRNAQSSVEDTMSTSATAAAVAASQFSPSSSGRGLYFGLQVMVRTARHVMLSNAGGGGVKGTLAIRLQCGPVELITKPVPTTRNPVWNERLDLGPTVSAGTSAAPFESERKGGRPASSSVSAEDAAVQTMATQRCRGGYGRRHTIQVELLSTPQGLSGDEEKVVGSLSIDLAHVIDKAGYIDLDGSELFGYFSLKDAGAIVGELQLGIRLTPVSQFGFVEREKVVVRVRRLRGFRPDAPAGASNSFPSAFVEAQLGVERKKTSPAMIADGIATLRQQLLFSPSVTSEDWRLCLTVRLNSGVGEILGRASVKLPRPNSAGLTTWVPIGGEVTRDGGTDMPCRASDDEKVSDVSGDDIEESVCSIRHTPADGELIRASESSGGLLAKFPSRAAGPAVAALASPDERGRNGTGNIQLSPPACGIEVHIRRIMVTEELRPTLGTLELELHSLKLFRDSSFEHSFRVVLSYADNVVATRTYHNALSPILEGECFAFDVKDMLVPLWIEVRDVHSSGSRHMSDGKLIGKAVVRALDLIEDEASLLFAAPHCVANRMLLPRRKALLTDDGDDSARSTHSSRVNGALTFSARFNESVLSGGLAPNANPISQRAPKPFSLSNTRHELNRLMRHGSWVLAIPAGVNHVLSWENRTLSFGILLFFMLVCTLDFWVARPLLWLPLGVVVHIIFRYAERIDGRFNRQFIECSNGESNNDGNDKPDSDSILSSMARLHVTVLKAEGLLQVVDDSLLAGRRSLALQQCKNVSRAHFRNRKVRNTSAKPGAKTGSLPLHLYPKVAATLSLRSMPSSPPLQIGRTARALCYEVPHSDADAEIDGDKDVEDSKEISFDWRATDASHWVPRNSASLISRWRPSYSSSERRGSGNCAFTAAFNVAVGRDLLFSPLLVVRVLCLNECDAIVDLLAEGNGWICEMYVKSGGGTRSHVGRDRSCSRVCGTSPSVTGVWNERIVLGDADDNMPLSPIDGDRLYLRVKQVPQTSAGEGRGKISPSSKDIFVWSQLSEFEGSLSLTDTMQKSQTNPRDKSQSTSTGNRNDRGRAAVRNDHARPTCGAYVVNLCNKSVSETCLGQSATSDCAEDPDSVQLTLAIEWHGLNTVDSSNRAEEAVVIHGRQDSEFARRDRLRHGLTSADSWSSVGSVLCVDVHCANTGVVMLDGAAGVPGSVRQQHNARGTSPLGPDELFLGRAELPIASLISNDQLTEQLTMDLWLPLRLRGDGAFDDKALESRATSKRYAAASLERRNSILIRRSHMSPSNSSSDGNALSTFFEDGNEDNFSDFEGGEGETAISSGNTLRENLHGGRDDNLDSECDTEIDHMAEAIDAMHIDSVGAVLNQSSECDRIVDACSIGPAPEASMSDAEYDLGDVLVRVQLVLPDAAARERYLDEQNAKKADSGSLLDRYRAIVDALAHLQNGLFHFNNAVEQVKNLFNWTHPRKTEAVLRCSLVILALLVLVPSRYVVLFVGLFMLTEHFRRAGTVVLRVRHLLTQVPTDDDLSVILARRSIASTGSRTARSTSPPTKAVYGDESTNTANHADDESGDQGDGWLKRGSGPRGRANSNRPTLLSSRSSSSALSDCTMAGHLRMRSGVGSNAGEDLSKVIWRRRYYGLHGTELLRWRDKAEAIDGEPPSSSRAGIVDVFRLAPGSYGAAENCGPANCQFLLVFGDHGGPEVKTESVDMSLQSRGPSVLKSGIAKASHRRRITASLTATLRRSLTRESKSGIQRQKRVVFVASSEAKRDLWVKAIERSIATATQQEHVHL